MIGPGPTRRSIAGPAGGRLLALVATCLVAALAFEEPLAIGGAAPDFVVVALVLGALHWGAAGGAALGFGLGLFRDGVLPVEFGLHALAGTALGYGIGKARETLYLTGPGVDLALLAGVKLALDVLVLAVAARGAWVAFEARFFWEAPVAALWTAVLGGLLGRAFAR